MSAITILPAASCPSTGAALSSVPGLSAPSRRARLYLLTPSQMSRRIASRSPAGRAPARAACVRGSIGFPCTPRDRRTDRASIVLGRICCAGVVETVSPPRVGRVVGADAGTFPWAMSAPPHHDLIFPAAWLLSPAISPCPLLRCGPPLFKFN